MANNSFFDSSQEPYNPLKSTFGNLGTQLKKLGATLGNGTAALFKGVSSPWKTADFSNAPQAYQDRQYYQVGPNDQSMADVAAANNVPLDQLVANNGGAQSLPPSGSYIALQPETQPGGYAYQYANPPQVAGSNAPPTGRGNPAGQMLVDTRNAVNDAFMSFNETYRLTGQVDASMLPTDITVSTVKALEQKGFFSNAVDAYGNPLTPAQALTQYGYVFKDGKFAKTGTPGGGGGGDQGPQAGQVMDNKFVAVYSAAQGKVVWKNMKAKQDQYNDQLNVTAAPRTMGANAATGPNTVLGLRLGSG